MQAYLKLPIMKYSFCIALYLFFIFTLKAQAPLQVDAGENQHFCYATDWIDISLGGNPTALGGTPPYTYRWWASPEEYIEDQTISNPMVSFLGSFIAYVEVTDAAENSAIDSMIVTMSGRQLNFSGDPQFMQLYYYINSGNSVFLNGNVSTLNPNSTFSWSPCESIVSDCFVADGFWAKPTATTAYYLTATDPFDCSETFHPYFYKVYVDHVGGLESQILDYPTIYPNPVKERLFFSHETKTEIIDIQGRVIYKTDNAIKYLDVSNLKTGIYFVKVGSEFKKIIKE